MDFLVVGALSSPFDVMPDSVENWPVTGRCRVVTYTVSAACGLPNACYVTVAPGVPVSDAVRGVVAESTCNVLCGVRKHAVTAFEVHRALVQLSTPCWTATSCSTSL